LAKWLGIKTIICKRTKGIPGRALVFEDYQKYQELFLINQSLPGEKNSINELSPQLQDYYQKQTDLRNGLIDEKYKEHVEAADKGKVTRIIPKWEIFARNIANGKLLQTTYLYISMLLHTERVLSFQGKNYNRLHLRVKNIKWNWLKKKYRKEYLSLQRNADLTRKFVYMPLHFQPECTTTPMGDVYADQILMIDTVAASLPKDWLIYVKENSIQWTYPRAHIARFRGFYKKISQNKNVQFVPLDTSTFDLIKHSQAVATVTGTASWEAIMYSKPSLVFGYPWFMHCEGIFRIDGVETCRQAFEKIKSGYQVDQRQVLKFLIAVDRASIPAYTHKRFAKHSGLSYEENVKIMAEAFYGRLNK
jgi:hypothetical protein